MGATIKEERIEIRLAAAEKERIRQAAVLSHQNVSEFVLRAVRTVADETLADARSVTVKLHHGPKYPSVLELPLAAASLH